MDTEEKLAKSLGIPYKIFKIRIGKFSINYLMAGDGKPLILIHGGNIGWGQWYPNISVFSKHFKVYAIDLPGAGRSTRIDFSQVDFQECFAHVLKQFIKKLSLNKPDVVGSSIGGWAAVKVALSGKVIGRLVVVNPVGFGDYSALQGRIIGFYPFAQLITKTFLAPNRGDKNIETFLRSVFYNRNLKLSREFTQYFYETTTTSHNLLFISKIISSLRKLLVINALPRLKNKTLIIWGDKDKYLPLEQNRSSFSLISNSRVKIFANAGHIVSIEKAHDFNRAVLDFLA